VPSPLAGNFRNLPPCVVVAVLEHGQGLRQFERLQVFALPVLGNLMQEDLFGLGRPHPARDGREAASDVATGREVLKL
jgi:hypothetical protein